jgi:hypothetical protein
LGSFPVLPVCKAPTETTTLPHKITATGCVVNNHITVPPIGCSHGEPIVAVDPFASPAVQFKSAPMVVQLLVYDRFDASNDSYVSSHPKRFATGTRKPLRVRMPLRLVKGKIVRLVVEYYLPYPDGRKIPPSFNLAHEYQAYSAYTFCTN